MDGAKKQMEENQPQENLYALCTLVLLRSDVRGIGTVLHLHIQEKKCRQYCTLVPAAQQIAIIQDGSKTLVWSLEPDGAAVKHGGRMLNVSEKILGNVIVSYLTFQNYLLYSLWI